MGTKTLNYKQFSNICLKGSIAMRANAGGEAIAARDAEYVVCILSGSTKDLI